LGQGETTGPFSVPRCPKNREKFEDSKRGDEHHRKELHENTYIEEIHSA